MSQARNNRWAILFFLVYLLLYSGFMLINVFRPEWMEWLPWAGVNLAIWYGFGLIFAAVVLAFLYGILCTHIPSESSGSSHSHGERGDQA